MNNDTIKEKPLPQESLEEYKLCQQKIKDLEDNIWKTAGLSSIGSISGIVILNNLSISQAIIISLFVIGVLLTWRRFVFRWLSIQQVLIRRMEKIEKGSQLRANLYIKLCDQIVRNAKKSMGEKEKQKFKVLKRLIDEDIREEFETFHSRWYQWRGIQPMIQFLICINIAIWLLFALSKSIQPLLIFIETKNLSWKFFNTLNTNKIIQFFIIIIFLLYFVYAFSYYHWWKE